MLVSLLRLLRQISRRIHVRVILFALLNLLALLLAVMLGPLIPQRLADGVGAEAVDTILSILATSMLAVTTFSLTIMVTALSNAASQWTPRAHLMLRQDTVTHSVLANFLGAYLFALVAIILRQAGLFSEGGVVVLFGMTLGVVTLIVVSLIRWIFHLEGLGSLSQTADTLEDEAARALIHAARRPCHGGQMLSSPELIPPGARRITAARAGYLQQVFEAALQSEAEAEDLRIYVVAHVGQHVLPGEVLAHVDGTPGENSERIIAEALPLARVRSFEQDPLFGLTVLSEIATRALSPGINDPGTAIDILHRLGRLLALPGAQQAEPVCHDRLWARPLDPALYYEVSLEPIARCAGDALEVHLAIRHMLAQVAAGPGPVAGAAAACADRCARRAKAAIRFEPDLARLQSEKI